MSDSKYYSYSGINSYNAVINMIPGVRGIGKTYGAKVNAVRKFIKTSRKLERTDLGDQFIFMRRFKSELTASRGTFFADFEHIFPDYDFRIEGFKAQIASIETRGEKKRPWFDMGFFVALSTAQTQKGVAFPRVKTIIFDEFIIEKGNLHYLPNEADVFINFYNTVDRYRDKTRVYMLANTVSIMNPYFISWNIRPDQMSEYTLLGEGFVCVHFPDASEFKASVYETRFGKFIKGTAYADYAVENQFDDDNDNLIKLKDKDATYKFTVETAKGVFSVWTNLLIGEYYVTRKRLRGGEKLFTIVPAKMSENKRLLHYSDPQMVFMRQAFKQGKMFFDQPNTRNIFAEVFVR